MNEDKTDNTKDDGYWRDNHSAQPYASSEHTYEHYEPAYRTGKQSFEKYRGRNFDDVEDDVAREYEVNVADGGLPWDHARHAVRAVWAKLSGDVTPQDRDRGMRGSI